MYRGTGTQLYIIRLRKQKALKVSQFEALCCVPCFVFPCLFVPPFYTPLTHQMSSNFLLSVIRPPHPSHLSSAPHVIYPSLDRLLNSLSAVSVSSLLIFCQSQCLSTNHPPCRLDFAFVNKPLTPPANPTLLPQTVSITDHPQQMEAQTPISVSLIIGSWCCC